MLRSLHEMRIHLKTVKFVLICKQCAFAVLRQTNLLVTNDYLNPSTKQDADGLCKYYICSCANESLWKMVLSPQRDIHPQMSTLCW